MASPSLRRRKRRQDLVQRRLEEVAERRERELSLRLGRAR